MPRTLKIVHPCDHMVVTSTKQYGEILITRGIVLGVHDTIPRNIRIIRIDSIMSTDGFVFKKGLHYTQTVSSDVIEWTGRDDNPKPGESYIVKAAYMLISSSKYEKNACERCEGNGWYVSLTNRSGQLEEVSGAAKLVQEFVKILNTERNDDGYGSRINDVLGMNVVDEAAISNIIAEEIQACASKIMEIQSESMGVTELSDEELLDSVEIKQIYFVKDTTTYVISLIIRSRAGRAMTFNFKL